MLGATRTRFDTVRVLSLGPPKIGKRTMCGPPLHLRFTASRAPSSHFVFFATSRVATPCVFVTLFHRPASSALQREERPESELALMSGGGASAALLAGSPLFLTDLNVPMYWGEIQFLLAGGINSLMESFFECEGGPLFLNAVVMATLLKMGTYYGFMQPSYLWHFQAPPCC